MRRNYKKRSKVFRKVKSGMLVAGIIMGLVAPGFTADARENKNTVSYSQKSISNVLSRLGDGEEKILGEDDRVLITNTKKAPYRYIGKFVIEYKSGESCEWGSGFLVGESTVLTAAHCAYLNQDDIESIIFYPGKNGTSNPYGGYRVSKIHIPSKYKTAAKNKDSKTMNKYDYALLELNANIGSELGYFKLGGYNTPYNISNLSNKKMVLTGYPGEKQNRLYKHKANIKGFNDAGYLMYYDMDTTNGQSGSPIYKYMDGDYYVVGIHIGYLETVNAGRYITKNIYELVEKYN